MATHGTVSPFYPNKKSWTNCAERLDHYFLANDVADTGNSSLCMRTPDIQTDPQSHRDTCYPEYDELRRHYQASQG